MRIKIENKKAFTLVELVITIAIIGIMLAVMIVSLSGQKLQKEVETEAIRVESILREAQNIALSGKGTTVAGCSRIVVDVNADSIRVRSLDTSNAACGSVNLSYPPQNGVVFASNPASGMEFRLPHGSVFNGGGELTAGSVKFTVTKGGTTWSVCVYPLGRIDRKMGNGC